MDYSKQVITMKPSLTSTMKPTLTVFLTALLFAPLAVPAAPAAEPVPAFQAALPVWPEGRETELNLFVEFRADFDRPAATPVSLRLTGALITGRSSTASSRDTDRLVPGMAHSEWTSGKLLQSSSPAGTT